MEAPVGSGDIRKVCTQRERFGLMNSGAEYPWCPQSMPALMSDGYQALVGYGKALTCSQGTHNHGMSLSWTNFVLGHDVCTSKSLERNWVRESTIKPDIVLLDEV